MQQFIQFLRETIIYRIQIENSLDDPQVPNPLILSQSETEQPLNIFLQEHSLSNEERLVFLMALIPHIDPGFFTRIIAKLFETPGEFAEFGGIKGAQHRGIIPTGETALYMLAGNDPVERINAQGIFDPDATLIKSDIIHLGTVQNSEPKFSGALHISAEALELALHGRILKPAPSAEFPANRISTELEWEQLILNDSISEEVEEIKTWLTFNDSILEDYNMAGIIKPGYRAILCGPPGTGKTLTATLLGKHIGRDVYRIDLSLVVSKFIGETEKNLRRLFDRASNQDWILFFDEADAIFGKRTSVRDAHDKYANQEVSYLLQRIESYEGLVILATNYKSNIDAAFTRRFNSIIEFKAPSAEERKLLWNSTMPDNMALEASISLDQLAQKYELTGSNIVNIVQYACLETLRHGENQPEMKLEVLLKGIEKEYKKENKMFS